MEQSTFQTEGFRPTIEPGLYRHYKGKFYRVVGVARHSETGEWYVVYQKQYDDFGFAIRPYGMFIEAVMYEGRSMLRFTRVGDSTTDDAGKYIHRSSVSRPW